VQKIGKKYLFHGKCLLNLNLGLCALQKITIYACFMPQNRPKSKKRLLTVYTISHGRRIFAHIQVGGLGGSGGWEESCKPAKIGPVSETARRFGPEDLVKTKFIIKYCLKIMDRAF
jgi:hypothetical protein